MKHQNVSHKPQPGLEQARRDQEAANRIVVAERRRQFDEQKKQLDILRKTRSQRNVGTLEIPRHLQKQIAVSQAQLDNESAGSSRRGPDKILIDPNTGRPFE